ncbi:tyrosine-type recombinase/integrase, partial [Actinomadura sp. NPDC049753]|uniref:tyrosine-type recombinase/integrase n=1 Tax=Actinomadura sp. NPDC049753 TaxID=3154739 RepID=UPI0034278C70
RCALRIPPTPHAPDGLARGRAAAQAPLPLDVNAGTVTVRQAQVESDTGELVIGPPKSRAGLRTVALPRAIIPELRRHLGNLTDPEPEALFFTGKRGGVLRRANFRRASKRGEAVAKLGVPELHFHDLRHTGNTFAAESGATLRDLMERMGHDSVRAALIYQHRTASGNRAIARAMDDKINKADSDDDEGAAGALAIVG